jgi:hypothetical protein
MFYSVVLLDGKELHCLSIEEVRDLFFKRQLNQDSLICSAEDGQWKMLRRTFDLSPWISAGAQQAALIQNNYQPSVNPFEQPVHANQPVSFPPRQTDFQPPIDPSNQPVTFNQFPPHAPSNNFGQNSANGYSQNNQTETYYQAETNQTNYNFQNNQVSVAPSKYGNAAGTYNYVPSFNGTSASRIGLKPAAVFLIINIIFYAVYVVFGAFLKAWEDNGAEKFGEAVGGLFIPVIIDLIFVVKLWKLDDVESGRKWGLFRSYYTLIVFGAIIPLICFGMGENIGGVFSLASAVFLYLSLALVLHGRENPSQGRIIFGAATFVIYFFIMSGTLALALIGKLAPEIAKLDIKNTQFEKYKVEGSEYQDKVTGAKVLLPEGWSMIKLDNPYIRTPEARMIAIDKAGNRLTMLEVVPVPGNLDMKRQNSALILDQLADNVVRAMNDQVKGHMIITYDELTFYVLHSWCPAEEYTEAQNDFTFFEKNFSVPDKINSNFTQTAESEKKP